jgi:hypothetical protein
MSDERPDVTEATLAGLKAASVHVLRAGQELVSAALAFVDELGDAFGEEPDRSNEDRSNEDRSNEDRSNEDRSNEDRSNEDRSNEDRSNEDRSNEDPGDGPQHIPVD